MRFLIESLGLKEAETFWGRFERVIDTQVQAIGGEASALLGRELRRAAPRRTGAGARSIQRRPARGERVGPGHWLWRFFARHYLLFTVPPGTRPHPIQARRARALRFYWKKGPRGPGIYFFKRVQHPGYRPVFDWRRVAMQRARPQIQTLLKRWQLKLPLYGVR